MAVSIKISQFNKKQIPIAIGSVVAVVAIMVCIIVFGKDSTPPVQPSTTSAPKTTAGTTKPTETTEPISDAPPTEPPTQAPTVPPTQPPMEYTVQSSIIIQGTRAMEIYGVASGSLTGYANVINNFALKVPTVNVYNLLAPTAVEFYGPEKYRTGGHSQAKGIGIAYAAFTAPNVKTVDALSEIQKHTDEYIYFRTDHHWTARGAYYAYVAFSHVAGVTPTKLEDHPTGQIDGFVGSMYTYTSASVLKDNPDYVEYFEPLTATEGYIYQDATMQNGRPLKVVNPNVTGKNKYLAFVEGDNPVEKIITANKNGRKIAIIKESYGNAFAPFLVDNFEEVYVLDPRKGDVNLTSFVTANGITDVIFINYPFAPSNPTYRAALDKMLG